MDESLWGGKESDTTERLSPAWHVCGTLQSTENLHVHYSFDPHLHHMTYDDGVRIQPLAFPQFSTVVFTLCSINEALLLRQP